jgi:hypothetical protein
MTYPAYLNGLTIEVRDGRHCVTNDFGGRIINTCIDLEDALEMRERASIGVPAHVVELVARLDADKNRAFEAQRQIAEETGSEPYRIVGTRSDLTTWAVQTAGATIYADSDEGHASALEQLLHNVRHSARHVEAYATAAE